MAKLIKYFRQRYPEDQEEIQTWFFELGNMTYCVNVYESIRHFYGKLDREFHGWKWESGEVVNAKIAENKNKRGIEDLTDEIFIEHQGYGHFQSPYKVSALSVWGNIERLLERYYTIDGYTLIDGSFGENDRNELTKEDYEMLIGHKFRGEDDNN